MTLKTKYSKINFCSNTFINVNNIILIDGKEPFRIRKGPVPIVSLYGALSPQNWITVVKRNNSSNKNISIVTNVLNSETTIHFLGLTIFHAVAKADELMVDVINLKVLGFDLVGNGEMLQFGGHTMSKNTFENVGSAIVIGKLSSSSKNKAAG